MEVTIAKYCDNLLGVDKHDKVQLVRLSTEELLIRRGGKTEFTVAKTGGHRRFTLIGPQGLMQSDVAALQTRRLALWLDRTVRKLPRGRQLNSGPDTQIFTPCFR